jgi:integrase
MSETQKPSYAVGFEALLEVFKQASKQCPKGIGLKRDSKNGKNYLLFNLTLPSGKRITKPTGEDFSESGFWLALAKANQVNEKIKSGITDDDFLKWYDLEVLGKNRANRETVKSRTWKEAIAILENYFWNKIDKRTKKRRDKNHPSHQSIWERQYEMFIKYLPIDNPISLDDIKAVVSRYEQGTKQFKECVSSLKKLIRLLKDYPDILDYLEGLDLTQTKFLKLQSITLDEWLEFRKTILGIEPYKLSESALRYAANRHQWDWVFSMQIVYGMRISEVWAIENLDEPYKADDGTVIPALSDPKNKDNLIVYAETTKIGTTIKTGFRIGKPMVPPSHPDLIEILGIKNPRLPIVKSTSNNADTIRKFYAKSARNRLTDWDAPITQTHAFRNLANANGIQAGIPQEIRAKSLGHTVDSNEKSYKKRFSTQTTVNLLTQSNKEMLNLVAALPLIKQCDLSNESEVISLLSEIYHTDISELI